MSQDTSLQLDDIGGGYSLPVPPPQSVAASSSSKSSLSCGGGGTNGGAPTLTTPTLTPTTLRNIEQMFAECDPHEPPHHHLNAAGFVPPIVSPTSGNSYAPLGYRHSPYTQLCNDTIVQLATENNGTRENPGDEPQPLDLKTTNRTSPTVTLSRPKSLPLLVPSLPRPQTLNILPRPQTLNIPSLITSSPSPSSSSANSSFYPSNGGLPARNIQFLDKFLKAAASSPLLNTPVNSAIIMLSPIKTENLPPCSSRTAASTTPPPLYLAASPNHQPPPLYQDSSPPQSPAQSLSPPPQFPDNRFVSMSSPTSSGGRGGDCASPTSSGGGGGGGQRTVSTDSFHDEDAKRAVRRERNKQAAARCRKRRLDLISNLQEEVSEWEVKVKSLKDELLELEGQKKGLEMVLNRHAGPCKKRTNPPSPPSAKS